MTGGRPEPGALSGTVAWGTTLVAALLWFAAFVALFRRDLGDPLVAAGLFTATGGVIFAAGRLIARRLSRYGR